MDKDNVSIFPFQCYQLEPKKHSIYRSFLKFNSEMLRKLLSKYHPKKYKFRWCKVSQSFSLLHLKVTARAKKNS